MAVFLPACEGPLEVSPSEGALIRTDRVAYELRPSDALPGAETTIGYELTNRTSERLFIANCRGSTSLSLEKEIGGEWVAVWSPAVFACLSPPIVVEPGETLARSLRVFGGDPGCDCGPRFDVEDRTGTYRLVLHTVYSSYHPDGQPFGDRLPKELRMSNRFSLTR